MTPYDDALYLLQKQVARAAQLRTLIPELRQRHTQMSSHVKDLHRSMRREQRDVDKLEGKTFTALYHYATGTMGSQLDKERKEACSVREAYNLAAAQLRDLEAELERSEAELADLEGCEARFQALLSEKLKFLKARGGEAAENIQTLEARIHKLDLQKKEIRDAIVAGRAALRAANQIERYLDDGRRQSIGDIVSTGILSEVFYFGKHSAVEEARSCIGEFRSKLAGFQEKLAKISVTTSIKINIKDFQHFGDFFSNRMFAAHDFHRKLNSAREEINHATDAITQTIRRLEELAAKLDNDQARIRGKLDKLILKAQ